MLVGVPFIFVIIYYYYYLFIYIFVFFFLLQFSIILFAVDLSFPICISNMSVVVVTKQARIQGGGGKETLPPPPPFSGEKNKGVKNHTHRKKDQNRTTTKQDTG